MDYKTVVSLVGYENNTWSRLENKKIYQQDKNSKIYGFRMKEKDGILYLLFKSESGIINHLERENQLYMTSYDIKTSIWKDIGNKGVIHTGQIQLNLLELSVSENSTPYVFFLDICGNINKKGSESIINEVTYL